MIFFKKKVVPPEPVYDKSLFEVFDGVCDKYADYKAITDEYNNIHMTYGDVKQASNYFASGLQSLGVQKGDFIALFSENHGRWITCDLGIIKCGAIDVVRGSNAPIDELEYIIRHSDSKALVLRDLKLFNKMKPIFNNFNLNFIILMFADSEIDKEGVSCPIYTYDEIIEKGKNNEFHPVHCDPDEPFTLLYTSGTTGEPKGVLLTNKNLIYQVVYAHEKFLSQPGENTLQVLPIWHAYERVGQYYYFSRACHMHFTTLTGLKNDLVKYDIDTMMSVPRIWEAMRKGIFQALRQKSPKGYRIFKTAVGISMAYKESLMYIQRRITNKRIYSPITTMMSILTVLTLAPLHKLFKFTIYKKLKKAAGLDFRATISGGGALTMQDEYFYNAINVDLRVGYGLTETAPVLTVRGVQEKNFLGSVGTALTGTELKIVDPTTFKELKPLRKGLVLAKGPQVFKGYYKDEESTAKVFTPDGWFNTGDLGWLTKEGNLVLFGRIKETIVLSTGENVEPVPIEDACLNSEYIEQIVLVGQDKNGIGALVIPSKKALDKCGVNMDDLRNQKSSAIDNQELRDLIKKEINIYIKDKPRLRPFEKIMKFEMLKEAFSMDNGLLTQSMKVKRNNVFEKYKDIIQKMYAEKK